MITFLCSDINAHGGAQNREYSWFAEAANEAAFRRLSNERSTLYSILPIQTRQINQNMMSTSKRMANTFSLKYRLETDSVCSVSAYLASGRMQLATPLWHVDICMLASALLASFTALFKCECGSILLMVDDWYLECTFKTWNELVVALLEKYWRLRSVDTWKVLILEMYRRTKS